MQPTHDLASLNMIEAELPPTHRTVSTIRRSHHLPTALIIVTIRQWLARQDNHTLRCSLLFSLPPSLSLSLYLAPLPPFQAIL
jgi:hypothetical protein